MNNACWKSQVFVYANIYFCHSVYAFYSTCMHPTYIGGLSDEPLLCVKDVLDASDQLQRTAVIRALKDKEHMCCVRAC